MKEIFKDILGYDGIYQVSNLGDVKSLSRKVNSKNNSVATTKDKNLSICVNKIGYSLVVLNSYGKRKNFRVHRLVAEAFIPNVENKPYVNHINGIKHDNRVENLEWCTAKENTIHAYNNGFNHRGEKHKNSKLTKEQIFEIRKDNRFQYVIAKEYGISQTLVYYIKSHKAWAHV